MAQKTLQQLCHEVDPEFGKKRNKVVGYEFGNGKVKREFERREAPGEAYEWAP